MSDTYHQRVGKGGFGNTSPKDDRGLPLAFYQCVNDRGPQKTKPVKIQRVRVQAPQYGPKFKG